MTTLATSQRPGVEADASVSRATAQWYVLYTKSRQEKALAEDLTRMGIGHFLPLLRTVKRYGGRKAVVHEPMFPGYVFLEGSINDLYAADRTRRVARTIQVLDQVQLRWELHNIRLALERDAGLTPWHGLVSGMRVRITAGSLMGLEGIIERGGHRPRLVLQVQMLGRSVSTEIDADLVEPIER